MEKRKNDRRRMGERRVFSYALYLPERRQEHKRRTNKDRRN